MKKALILLAAGASLAAAPALAGGPQPAPAEAPLAPAVPVADTSPDWTGFYGGVQLGYADVDTNAPGVSGDDFIGGVTFGYDYDLGDWVVGGALDYDWADIGIAPGTSVENVFRAKLRGGYKIGKGLVYATGGYADVQTDLLGDDDGYFAGVGYEHLITDQFSVGGEVLYHDINNFNSTPTDVEATTVQVRGTFRF